ncbi:MAG: hypothetical protein QM796_04855 [Chthoniobacteraceae bacterium]
MARSHKKFPSRPKFGLRAGEKNETPATARSTLSAKNQKNCNYHKSFLVDSSEKRAEKENALYFS